VQQQGWKGVTNGELLQQAADQGFEVLVTADHNLEFQQNLERSPVGFVVLRAPSNDLDDLLPLVSKVLEALTAVKPGHVLHVAV
jgi:hypothetical protein